MRIYQSGGGDKDWMTCLTERESLKIHYSGGTHEHPRIPNLLQGTCIMLTFLDNMNRPEKVLLRLFKTRRHKK